MLLIEDSGCGYGFKNKMCFAVMAKEFRSYAFAIVILEESNASEKRDM